MRRTNDWGEAVRNHALELGYENWNEFHLHHPDVPWETWRYWFKAARKRIATPTSYDQAWEELCNWIGWHSSVEQAIPLRALSKGWRKTIIICDPHGYHCWYEGLARVLVDEADADRIVIAGDITDSQAISRYADLKTIPLREDFARATATLEKCAEVAPTEIIGGNHDQRVAKWVATHVPPDYQFLVETDIVKLIAHNLPNVSIVGQGFRNEDGSKLESVFFTMVGDCIIGHAETSSVIPLRPVQNFHKWLYNWGPTLGLPEYRCVIQAHTHRFGKFPERGGAIQLMEGGSMLRLDGMSYGIETGNIKYQPPQRGYTKLIQCDGRTDFNETTYILMGEPAPTVGPQCTPTVAAGCA